MINFIVQSSLKETFARGDARIKKAKIYLIFVENLANSSLFPAISASISQILSLFSLAPLSCKALLKLLINNFFKERKV